MIIMNVYVLLKTNSNRAENTSVILIKILKFMTHQYLLVRKLIQNVLHR